MCFNKFKSINPKIFQNFFTRLCESDRKGDSGRICIVGGSKNYSGAPYFSAFTTLRCGGDLAYVICCQSAASSIKSFSPELIVLPILDDEKNFETEILSLLPKFHSLVIGPGLSYDKNLFKNVSKLINLAKKKDIPLTLDAEAVLLVGEEPSLVKNYKKTILTPNAKEFNFLCENFNLKKIDLNQTCKEDDIKARVLQVAKFLNGVTVLRKGPIDYISNGKFNFENNLSGSKRRCGGQGDILAGMTGVFHYWTYKFGLFNENDEYDESTFAAIISSYLTRITNSLAYEKFGRSMITTDMLTYINDAFKNLNFI